MPGGNVKTCTIDGCEKPLRAKGMCSTHYNRKYQPNRHQKRAQQCAWCGVNVVKHHRSERVFGVVCSIACRAHLQALARIGGERSGSTELVTYHAERKPRTDARPRAIPALRKRWFAGRCTTCRAGFVSETTSMTCSEKCAATRARRVSREHKHRRRARMRSAFVDPVNADAIYQRDNWTCWLCHTSVDMSADPQADSAPSIDHIIPLANGGTHEPANAITACRGCNARRSNRPHLIVDGHKVAVLF